MISIDGLLPLEFAAVCHTSLSLSLIHLTNGDDGGPSVRDNKLEKTNPIDIVCLLTYGWKAIAFFFFSFSAFMFLIFFFIIISQQQQPTDAGPFSLFVYSIPQINSLSSLF